MLTNGKRVTMGWFPKLLIARTVDTGTEQVHCPVRLGQMSLESCRPCPYLHALDSDEAGQVHEITCAPSLRVLAKPGAAD